MNLSATVLLRLRPRTVIREQTESLEDCRASGDRQTVFCLVVGLTQGLLRVLIIPIKESLKTLLNCFLKRRSDKITRQDFQPWLVFADTFGYINIVQPQGKR